MAVIYNKEMDETLTELYLNTNEKMTDIAKIMSEKFNAHITYDSVKKRVSKLELANRQPKYPLSDEQFLYIKNLISTWRGDWSQLTEQINKDLNVSMCTSGIKSLLLKRGISTKLPIGKSTGALFIKKSGAGTKTIMHRMSRGFGWLNKEILFNTLQYIDLRTSQVSIPEAVYQWVLHGNKLESDMSFIYWDDNRMNCAIENIFPVNQKELKMYVWAKQNLPKGDVALNKDIYKRIHLEQEIKKYEEN